MVRMRLQIGVYETLMPDVVAPEVHQNNCSYVDELSGTYFRFTMQQFSMVGGYIKEFRKPLNCQNWGVGAFQGQFGTKTSCMCTFVWYITV